jgi:hypothetical protein
MKNTNNLLLLAAITSLLIMGTSVIPMQSYAGSASDDYKSKIKSSTQTDKKSASQNMDQDNFCYRGNECKQANQGQQIVGKDNDAKGFNDQSNNVPPSTPSTTPTPTPTPTTAPKTCEQCFTTFLNSTQIDRLLSDSDQPSIAALCNASANVIPSESQARMYFSEQQLLSDDIINNLIKCLKEAGIVFRP